MTFVVRGRIGTARGNEGRTGELTYLAETGDYFYIWDGLHKAAQFETAQAGLDAANECKGPWFRMPDPGTIESVNVQDVMGGQPGRRDLVGSGG
jgi:hypothetical protein